MSVVIQDLRSLRRELAEARGRKKIDLLLEAPDPLALVRALPPQELYLTLLEVGPEDAAEVVALASAEQFRHFIDLSAWPRSDEGPREGEVIRWLRIAREGAGGRHLGRIRGQIRGLDIELLALVLRRELTVHELSEDNQPDAENPNLAYYTSDRRFLLEFKTERDFVALREVIEDLYAQEPFAAGRLLETIRWEVPTELEETARRWREGRLRDLGVPGFEEALSFYARPAARPDAPAAVTTALTVPGKPLLDEALDLLRGAELDTAEEALVYASNAALVANRVDLNEANDVREQLADARATLSLGLEVLSAGDPREAAHLLVERPVRELFQAGMGEAYKLQTKARKVAAALRLPQAQSTTLLDEPLESGLQALLKVRPLLHELGKRRPRALGSRADVLLAQGYLDQAAKVTALLSSLDLAPARLGPLAEATGLGPAAVKAGPAFYALIESQLKNEPFSLKPLLEESRPRSPGFEEQARKLDPEGLLKL
jgi:hypothetical protein